MKFNEGQSEQNPFQSFDNFKCQLSSHGVDTFWTKTTTLLSNSKFLNNAKFLNWILFFVIYFSNKQHPAVFSLCSPTEINSIFCFCFLEKGNLFLLPNNRKKVRYWIFPLGSKPSLSLQLISQIFNWICKFNPKISRVGLRILILVSFMALLVNYLLYLQKD